MIKYYVKKNCIPIIFEIFFIISCFLVPKEYIIYTNCLFYVCLFIYYILKRDLNLKDWFFSFKSGKKYWEQVGLTLLGFMLAFGITIALENIFPNIDTGFIGLRGHCTARSDGSRRNPCKPTRARDAEPSAHSAACGRYTAPY